MAIPLTLIGGYLGSGKTTLINRLLTSPGAGRTAVVVNDFGDVNIDAALIAATGADTLELTNGCICCQITDDVQRTMAGLAARADIDGVLCEVSGIGDPSQLGTWRTYPGFRPGPVVVCADALVTPRRLADEFVGDVVHRQIASADLVLVTKTDLASTAQVEATVAACTRAAPGARILPLSNGDPAPLLAVLPTGNGDGEDGGGGRGLSRSAADAPPPVDHSGVHRTTTVQLAPTVDADALTALLDLHADRLMRAKGFVPDTDGAWTQIHLAGGEVTVAPIPAGSAAPPRAELVLIAAGPGADETLAAVAHDVGGPAAADAPAGPVGQAGHSSDTPRNTPTDTHQ